VTTAAYWVALATIVTVPPFMLVWLIVHPFTRHWRRLGPLATYLALLAIIVPLMAVIYRCRGPLMRVQYGGSAPVMIAALVLFAAACGIGVLRMRRLGPAVMFGLPQLSSPRPGGSLITDGIYAHLRHPRYVEVGLSLAAIALFTGYLSAYVLAAGYIPVIYLVVLLEESELSERFGSRYDEYCRRVPRFVPRLSHWRRRAVGPDRGDAET
jgi:protein-S-isoprenylcysteine O-methyltransferase Ste14